ncbi:alkylglycerol monooxygenase isoform X2 [Cephus cinctus]|uniref:Alkylglycerol monooxygenase n=1 Tax=Cephus cinctus TaxID=211228 RepID=A0AAJ7VYZ5_CEPCN|nr:alkylglycerol monooxygenase isoform X2 [Cephus cinctus]
MNETYNKNLYHYLGHLKDAGKLWYLINPYETTFEHHQDVPDYQQQVWLSFFILIVLEHVILFAKNESSFRLNDHVTSLSHWIFQESGRIFFRGVEYYAYIAIYEKYRLCSLAWDSPWTWYVTVIGVDFCYYWVHQVHFLWAQHQVHHSSEEFNLVVGLRQSVLQHWLSFAFYLPLALFIPPSHFVAHHQFNLIYQLWIHTTVIKDLGPFEFIFNTPKHHRVHHGCNLYCLDKNYGGVLIVWDRLFGTFMEERPKEDIIFGLVSSPNSFNPIYLQTFYTIAMIQRSLSMKSLNDKLAVIWKGPSWFPSAPRLGLDEFKINVTHRTKYNPKIPSWKTIYIFIHFCMVFYCHIQLYDEKPYSSSIHAGTLIINNIFALTTIGLMFDNHKYAGTVELVRCAICIAMWKRDSQDVKFFNIFVLYAYIVSSCIWIVHIFTNRNQTCKSS